MATYSNPHWLLSHIRNSFISTDDTGICETVMASDDLPKHYLKKYQGNGITRNLQQQQQRKSMGQSMRNYDPPLQEVDFICYPGLDQSDDEDLDLAAQSFDIQMYPEVGAHRFRSNTAQKLEKMNIARRKAARIIGVSYDDEVVPPDTEDFFSRKSIKSNNLTEADYEAVKSKLTVQLANSPKQIQNKFQEYAKYDGTSQTGVQTKRINVFISMLPEKERNYPIKICALGNAKIFEVIGLVCYKVSIQYPDLVLKSIRHYGLYMTEDIDDLEDFPPLDNKEPFSKFGFSHLTLAEKRPVTSASRDEYGQGQPPTKSMTSEEEKARLATMAMHSLTCTGIGSDGFHSPDSVDGGASNANNSQLTEGCVDDLEERILSQDDMLEAPVYRTYTINIIDKKFFKTEVLLGISGERIEIDQHKNAKFWTKQRSVTYPIDAVAHCEIVEKRTMKSILRIWLKTQSAINTAMHHTLPIPAQSPNSPSHYSHPFSSPFNFLSSSSGSGTVSTGTGAGSSAAAASQQMRFKHYDFETTVPMAEHIHKKLCCILEMRGSDVRKEFLQMKQRKLEKSQAKKHLKL